MMMRILKARIFSNSVSSNVPDPEEQFIREQRASLMRDMMDTLNRNTAGSYSCDILKNCLMTRSLQNSTCHLVL